MDDISIEYECQEFVSCLTKYIELSGKIPAEAINKKLKDCALWATKFTHATSKEKIREDRMAPSRVNPQAPLQAILINSKTLAGHEWHKMNLRTDPGQMKTEIEKDIRKAQRSANFVKAGWKKAADKMRREVKEITGEIWVDTNIWARGDNLGRAEPARNNDAGIVEGSITNAVHGKNNSPQIQRHAAEGARQAMIKVREDMQPYIERKQKQAMEKAGLVVD